MKTFNINKLIPLALIVLLAACKDYDPSISQSETSQDATSTTLEVLEKNGYNLFLDAVAHADLELPSADTLTIFAPTNEAFVKLLSDAGVDAITDISSGDVRRILRYHITETPFTATSTDQSLTSVQGGTIYPTYSVDGTIGLNGRSTVVEANMFGTDGVAHGISQVMDIPEATVFDIIEASEVHTTLEALLIRVGLDATLSSASSEFTVFAPDDDALGLPTDYDGLSDGALDSILRFHVIGSRIYQTELANGRTASVLGVQSGQQQELEILDNTVNTVTINSDSANYNAENGTVHFIGSVLLPEDVIADYNVTWQTLNDAITEPDIDYTDIDQLISIMNFDDATGLTPLVGDFADEDEIQTWLNQYTFDGEVAFRSTASGSKITSIGGDEYYLQHSAAGTFSVNNQGYLSVSSQTTYNGYRNRFFAGAYPTPLPEDDITQVLKDNGYPLMAAFLEVTGKDAAVDAADVTFFTVSDAAMTFYFGYTDPADIDTLSQGGEEDVEVTDAFLEFIDNHIVPGEVTSSLIIGDDLIEQTALSGKLLDWIALDGDVVIILDTDDPQAAGGTVSLNSVDIWANNGVIHELTDIIPAD